MTSLSHSFPAFARLVHPIRRWLTWRLARRCLLALSGTATVVALFYQVENWRGRLAWERVEKAASARGLYVSWSAMPPSNVSDADNVFAAPVMRDFVLTEGKRGGTREGLRPGDERWMLRSARPPQGNRPGETGDLAGWRAFTGKQDLVLAFEENAADMAAVAQACERPRAVIPAGHLLPAFDHGEFLAMGRLFALRARVYREAGKKEEAAGDVRTLLHAVRHMNEAPGRILLSALVANAMAEEARQVVAEGIKARTWDAKTLAEFDDELGGLDLLQNCAQVFEGEFTLAMTVIQLVADGDSHSLATGSVRWSPVMRCPRGWILQNAASYQREWEDLVPAAIHPAARRIDLSRFEALDRRLPEYRGTPYGFILGIGFANKGQAMATVSSQLTRIDLTRVACRLEQHRLAHGEYPASLGDLARPPERDRLHDLLTGAPFQYSRIAGRDLYTLASGEAASSRRVLFE